jgi:hypothetical protein
VPHIYFLLTATHSYHVCTILFGTYVLTTSSSLQLSTGLDNITMTASNINAAYAEACETIQATVLNLSESGFTGGNTEAGVGDNNVNCTNQSAPFDMSILTASSSFFLTLHAVLGLVTDAAPSDSTSLVHAVRSVVVSPILAYGWQGLQGVIDTQMVLPAHAAIDAFLVEVPESRIVTVEQLVRLIAPQLAPWTVVPLALTMLGLLSSGLGVCAAAVCRCRFRDDRRKLVQSRCCPLALLSCGSCCSLLGAIILAVVGVALAAVWTALGMLSDAYSGLPFYMADAAATVVAALESQLLAAGLASLADEDLDSAVTALESCFVGVRWKITAHLL